MRLKFSSHNESEDVNQENILEYDSGGRREQAACGAVSSAAVCS